MPGFLLLDYILQMILYTVYVWHFSPPEPRAPGELKRWLPPSSVVLQNFQRTSPLKLLSQCQLNFIRSLQADGGWGGGKSIYMVYIT